MKRLFCIPFILFSYFAQSETASVKSAKFPVEGVGSIRIQHSVPGEPVSQPERVEVFLTCSGSKSSSRVALFRMCIYEGHTYEAGTKAVTLKMYYGRVEPKTGDVVCDQFDLKQVPLSDLCGK